MINTGEMIANVFSLWYASGIISDQSKEMLRKYTDFDEYKGAPEFFRACDLLDNEGNITDWGKQTIQIITDAGELDINNLELDELTDEARADQGDNNKESVGTHSNSNDDRTDPDNEPARLTAEEWAAAGYYAVGVKADPGNADRAKKWTAKSYEEYLELRDYIHETGYYITTETFWTYAEYFPGLLTYEGAKNEFETADDRIIEMKSFPRFSETAKIKLHDSVVLAADTGAGKSSLVINFLNDLNENYPAIYFNLEMDNLEILRRLVAIRTGLDINDRIANYKTDERTAEAVNAALRAITSRKPLQVLTKARTLTEIEKHIKHATEDREEPTIVIIDHSLLVTTGRKSNGRYERFTEISETLRRISLDYNIILFILLQQNRSGKADEDERPKNSSLKESGSWENDATHICFLWWDNLAKRKKLLITKNRHGDEGEFVLNYWKNTQRYCESKDQPATSSATAKTKPKQSKRDRERAELENAYLGALIATDGNPTLYDLAEILDVTTTTVKKRIKEYGLGFTIDGMEYNEAAGAADVVEYTGFRKETPGEASTAENFTERI